MFFVSRWIGMGVVATLVLAATWSQQSNAQDLPTAPAPAPASGVIAAAQEKLKKTFPSFQFERMEESPIPGIVEIYTSGKIIYYAPTQEVLLVGEMWTANGVSLTDERVSAYAGAKAKDIDRSVALQMGSGDRELIEFVDPECGHCRQAYNWFATNKPAGIKHFIYFMPRKGSAQAEARVLELLCAAPDQREAALERVFNPKAPLDLQKSVRCKEGIEQLAAQAEVVKDMGVPGTPFYVLDGKVIPGFTAERMAALLSSPPTKISQVQNP